MKGIQKKRCGDPFWITEQQKVAFNMEGLKFIDHVDLHLKDNISEDELSHHGDALCQ